MKETVTSMDAGVEPTGKCSRRVYGLGAQFIYWAILLALINLVPR